MLSTNPTIGFIGIGVMGSSMAEHLLDAGYPLKVFTRTKNKAQGLLDKGASWVESVSKLASDSDIIITMVGYPNDVKSIYFGMDGILENAKTGSYVVDMTTSKPSLAMEIHDNATTKSIYSLDAPVSGGDTGAKEGTLSIMVGGDQQVFNYLSPIFNLLGKNIILQGPAGAGQHTKLVNQITIASNMIGVCEAIVYAEKAGLNPLTVLDSIKTGAAGSWSLSNLAPRMIKGDYAPGFFIKHFIKDMKLALESAQEMGMSTPGLSLSLALYKELEQRGEGDSGTQALIKYFNESIS